MTKTSKTDLAPDGEGRDMSYPSVQFDPRTGHAGKNPRYGIKRGPECGVQRDLIHGVEHPRVCSGLRRQESIVEGDQFQRCAWMPPCLFT
jgi:hypothetical protein